MKTLGAIMIAALAGVLFGSPAHAQPTPTASPELCAESDGLTPAEIELCSSVDDEGGDAIDVYPIPPTVAPSSTTSTVPPTVAPSTTQPPVLPATGSSGTSGFLQLGALIVTGGLLVLVAARRRSTVVAPTT